MFSKLFVKVTPENGSVYIYLLFHTFNLRNFQIDRLSFIGKIGFSDLLINNYPSYDLYGSKKIKRLLH